MTYITKRGASSTKDFMQAIILGTVTVLRPTDSKFEREKVSRMMAMPMWSVM